MNRIFSFIGKNRLKFLLVAFAILTSVSSVVLGYTHMVTLMFLILFAYTMGADSTRSYYKSDIQRLRRNIMESEARVMNVAIQNVEKSRRIIKLHAEKQHLLKEIDILRNPETEEEFIQAEIDRINS